MSVYLTIWRAVFSIGVMRPPECEKGLRFFMIGLQVRPLFISRTFTIFYFDITRYTGYGLTWNIRFTFWDKGYDLWKTPNLSRISREC